MLRKVFSLLLLSILVPALVFASGRGKIGGKVMDAGTRKALADARVVVTGTSMAAVTDTALNRVRTSSRPPVSVTRP